MTGHGWDQKGQGWDTGLDTTGHGWDKKGPGQDKGYGNMKEHGNVHRRRF